MTLRSLTVRDITGTATSVNRLTAARVRKTIARILKRSKLCAIATVGADRRAHVNTAYFAYSGVLEVYFLSHPDSQHCRNLRTTPTIAIAVFDSTQEWGGMDRGLQLFGKCAMARGKAVRKAERAYGARFKPYVRWKRDLKPDDLASDYRLYRFVAHSIKVFDEREFGGATFVTAKVS